MLKEIIDRVSEVEGWFNAKEMSRLYETVKNLPSDGLLVELGTWKGRSTLFFRLSNPDIKIITIDACEKFWDGDTEVEKIEPEILALGNIEYIQKYSFEVVLSFNKKIDFLFIDHDHSFNAVTKALSRWVKFIRVGGYILFHDYKDITGTDGVFRSVNQWLENTDEWEVVPLSDVEMYLVRRNGIIKP